MLIKLNLKALFAKRVSYLIVTVRRAKQANIYMPAHV